MRLLPVAATLLAACSSSHDVGDDTVPVLDPLGYGTAGSQWTDVDLDLGDRSGGAPSSVHARYHAPGKWKGDALPMVVFAHDAGVSIDAYADLANHVASHGFVVALAQYDTARLRDGAGLRQDLVATMFALQATPPVFEGLTVLTDRFVVAGHGRGARQAIVGAVADPRVAGVFGIDPVDGEPGDTALLLPDKVGAVEVPLGLMGAGKAVAADGCVPADRGYEPIFGRAPTGTVLWEVPSAGHDDVVDSCAGGSDSPLCTACAPGDDPGHVSHLARASLLVWAARVLQDEAGYDAWLTTERVSAYLPDAVVRTR